ncbi:MAG TPA: hypothetical protein VK031_02595, partial [Tissierellaceae bacterium]|nr:hypothetical protein [Tissierellaceae bacterium]
EDGKVTQYKTDVEDGYGDYSRDNLLNTFSFKGGVTEEEWFNRVFIPHNDIRFSTVIKGIKDKDSSDIIYYRQRFNSGGQQYSVSNLDDNNLRAFNPFNEVNTSSNVSHNLISVRSKNVNGKTVKYIDFEEDIRSRLKIEINVTSVSGIYTASDMFYVANLKVNPEASGTVNEYDISDIVGEVKELEKLNGGRTETFTIDVENDTVFSGGLIIGAKHALDGVPATDIRYIINSLTVTVYGSEDDPSTVGIKYNEEFNVFDSIPKEISIRDFLKSVMLTSNLFLTVDKEDSTKISLYTYDEFYDKVLNFDRKSDVDWSKYNISSNISLPRGYDFLYKEDKDIMNTTYTRLWNEVYGTKRKIDSSGLTEVKKVELMFSPTIPLRSVGDFELPVIYEAEGIGIGEKKQMKSNLRLLMFSGVVNTSTFVPDTT